MRKQFPVHSIKALAVFLCGFLGVNGFTSGITAPALGNLTLVAGQIHNLNAHFATQSVLVSQSYFNEYQLPGSPNRWRYPDARVTQDEGERTISLVTPEGLSRDGRFYQYDITRTVYEDRVIQSDPGQLLAGGQLYLAGGTLLNDNSRILAGGALIGI